MDLQVDTCFDLEGKSFQDEDDSDFTVPVDQACGLCLHVVIDRGVLDCCQHWFCFECIDYWATITNFCPECKLEFQTITCLPVYDTIGSINAEEHPISKEDDWCIQGMNNTLSFPSYYIDEDAVICLDGDGCKIRSGLSTNEHGSTTDTSIACDSCDLWYHAFCVGFNPECTSENSWFCPRCIADEVSQKSDGIGIQNIGQQFDLKVADSGWSNNSSFSSRVSISLADTGETAIVVSMIEEKPMVEANDGIQTGSPLDFKTDKKTETSVPDLDTGNAKPDMQLNRSSFLEPIGSSLVSSEEIVFNTNASDIQERSESIIDVSTETPVMQRDVSLILPTSTQGASGERNLLKPEYGLLETSISVPISTSACFPSPCAIIGKNGQPGSMDEYNISYPQSQQSSVNKSRLPEVESVINIHPSLSMLSKFADRSGHSSTEGSSLSADKKVRGSTENIVEDVHNMNFEFNALEGKYDWESLSDGINVDSENHQSWKRERDTRAKMETEYSPKKVRCEQKPQKLHLKAQANSFFADYRKSSFKSEAVSEDSNLCPASKRQRIAPDIMTIVKEKNQKCQNGPGSTTPMGKFKGKRDGVSGLRVKKIMRRVAEKKETSTLLEKLRKEIREAVGNKTSNIIGKEKVFTGELLKAFRAALVKPQKEVVSKPDTSHLRMRKQSLLKGKSRESLTRKIYATSTGRRKRAWDRDWEIEFWKHRCTRARPEKVETLQSVLKLLKKVAGTLETSDLGEELEMETKNSLLSRVFLADASVFPRKDDIKPLSILEGCPTVYNPVESKEDDLCRKGSQPVDDSILTKGPKGATSSSDVKFASSDNANKTSNTSISKRETSFGKGKSDEVLTRAHLTSRSNRSEESSPNSKELTGHSDFSMVDKRKWALEVLARKSALTNMDPSSMNQEDRSTLNRNFPLLAQLPSDIRPVLAPSHHNKVPVSVRQTQLYRITEYYLGRASLPVIRRSAETELAVADAINVEREIFERSNSKSVYINVCSQFLSQRGNKPQTVSRHAHDSETTVIEDTGHIEDSKPLVAATNTCSKIEEALKLAGLLSDSPPNSPCRNMQDADEETSYAANAREEVLENVLDMGSHSELEMDRDFEHNMQNDGYIASSSMSDFAGLSHPDNGDSKIKVLLSPLSCGKSDNSLDSKNDMRESKFSGKESTVNVPDNSRIVQRHSDASTLIEHQKETCKQQGLEACTDAPGVVEPCQEELTRETSVEESEELYGMDKDPIIKRMSDEIKTEANKFLDEEAVLQCSHRYGDNSSIMPSCEDTISKSNTQTCAKNNHTGSGARFNIEALGVENSLALSVNCENAPEEGKTISDKSNVDPTHSISAKVEAYVKEHIRPLCKSGVISVEQYRWAVAKTTEKVIKFHYKAKNANFLIKEGEKVKKLAEQYVETAQHKECL